MEPWPRNLWGGAYSDLRIEIDEQSKTALNLHRNVLTLSPVFQQVLSPSIGSTDYECEWLRYDSKNGKATFLRNLGVDPEVIKKGLMFLYKRMPIDYITSDNVFSFMKFADLLIIDSLKALCLEFIRLQYRLSPPNLLAAANWCSRVLEDINDRANSNNHCTRTAEALYRCIRVFLLRYVAVSSMGLSKFLPHLPFSLIQDIVTSESCYVKSEYDRYRLVKLVIDSMVDENPSYCEKLLALFIPSLSFLSVGFQHLLKMRDDDIIHANFIEDVISYHRRKNRSYAASGRIKKTVNGGCIGAGLCVRFRTDFSDMRLWESNKVGVSSKHLLMGSFWSLRLFTQKGWLCYRIVREKPQETYLDAQLGGGIRDDRRHIPVSTSVSMLSKNEIVVARSTKERVEIDSKGRVVKICPFQAVSIMEEDLIFSSNRDGLQQSNKHSSVRSLEEKLLFVACIRIE